MTYTFDEAEKEINEALDLINYEDMDNKIDEVFKKLREEYAPTVEMTKFQNEAFVESVEGIATQEQLDSFVDEELDLGDMTVRKGLNAWIHPETIKIKE